MAIPSSPGPVPVSAIHGRRELFRCVRAVFRPSIPEWAYPSWAAGKGIPVYRFRLSLRKEIFCDL
jgi:hypothetical protein